MKAIVQTGIGEPVDVLSLREVPAPAPADDGIVIDVSLASVHHGDLFFIRSPRPARRDETYRERHRSGWPGSLHRWERGGKQGLEGR